VRVLQAAVADRANAVEYCYCSIFDECWTVDSRTPGAGPAGVAACPDYGDGAFRN
jgi:hypothetical protein